MSAVKIFRYLFLFLAAAIIFNCIESCTQKSRQPQQAKDINELIRTEIEKYTYPLPSAFEASEMLKEIEAGYLADIINQPQKAENYFTEESKALNLGIYISDLAYATTYNKRQDIRKYFEACETLVRNLDFASAFAPGLANRIEGNFDNKDQLVEIITEMFQNAYAYLNRQGRSGLSYLVLFGTNIEGLYLTTHISENTFQNIKIIEAILFQKEPLTELQKMMESKKDTELLNETYRDIKQINEIYAQEPGNTSLTEKQVTELTGVVTKIRNNYINRQ
jgi:NurA-like 5'-3' nuclease